MGAGSLGGWRPIRIEIGRLSRQRILHDLVILSLNVSNNNYLIIIVIIYIYTMMVSNLSWIKHNY